MLLKRQRNDFFKILVEYNLQSTDFFEENKSEKYALRSKKGPYFFTVNTDDDDSHQMSCYPYIQTFEKTDWFDWADVLQTFREWVEILKEEEEAPDLWEDAQINSKLFALNPVVPNELFNDAELRQIQGQVRQLVQGLMTLGLPANAQKLLTETVNEIPEKATRFTKKELTGWFMGAFAAQVTNLALSQEHISAIATLIKTTFMGILQLH